MAATARPTQRTVYAPLIPPRPDPRGGQRRRLLAACWAGTEPAESLEPREREHLIYDLWRADYTDAQMAVHCRMTTYTAARIRSRLGLAARRDTATRSAG